MYMPRPCRSCFIVEVEPPAWTVISMPKDGGDKGRISSGSGSDSESESVSVRPGTTPKAKAAPKVAPAPPSPPTSSEECSSSVDSLEFTFGKGKGKGKRRRGGHQKTGAATETLETREVREKMKSTIALG